MGSSPRPRRSSTVREIEPLAVIGFGSQGKAQAELLRRAGLDVTIGLPARSGSRRFARSRGFEVTTPQKAVRGRKGVAVLVPDRVAAEVLAELGPQLEVNSMVVVAAGYPLVFGGRTLPSRCDVVLVAPHGPGRMLEAGERLSGFIGVQQDVTGRARLRARRYAQAIGLRPLYDTTARDEALGDIFGEQALLCGGLVGLAAAVAQTMVERGIPAENAYFETTAQLRNLADLLETRGLDGFWEEISDCAAAGMASAAPVLFDRAFRRRLGRVWQDIESGGFARRFQRRGRPTRPLPAWEILNVIAAAAKRKGGHKDRPG